MIGRDAKGDSTMAFTIKGQPPIIEKETCKICGDMAMKRRAAMR